MKVGQISRMEFAAFLLPKDDLELRQVVAQRVENPQNDEIPHEIEVQQMAIFTKMLLEIINREMKIIELRRQLLSAKDYSMVGVVQAMDQHGHGWVSGDDLFVFLKNYGVEVTVRQVEKLVQVINCSLDGKVTEDQLRWTVEGFENKGRDYLQKVKDSNRKEVVMTGSAKRKVEVYDPN